MIYENFYYFNLKNMYNLNLGIYYFLECITSFFLMNSEDTPIMNKFIINALIIIYVNEFSNQVKTGD